LETRADIVSRSLADARRDLPKLDDGDAVVSIGSPRTDPPAGLESENPRHLRLEFDDVTSQTSALGTRELHPPQRDHVETLVERSDLLLAGDLVYCHCAAGISRSTAAAYILECRRRADGSEPEAFRAVVEDNPFASPNRRMVQLADDVMSRDGAMIDALEIVTRHDGA